VGEAFRIGFDLDGVLADLGSAMSAIGRRLAGPAAALPAAASEAVGEAGDGAGAEAALTREIWRDIRDTENFWETLAEIEPGSVMRLAALAEEHLWETLFLTQRPPTRGDTTQRQCQRWLTRHGFACPSVCVVSGSRGRVADVLGLTLVVDDRPENCVDVVNDSKATAVLIWRGGQHPVARGARRLGIAVADSVGDCLDRLAAGFISPGSRDGLAARLKRWIDPSTDQPE